MTMMIRDSTTKRVTSHSKPSIDHDFLIVEADRSTAESCGLARYRWAALTSIAMRGRSMTML